MFFYRIALFLMSLWFCRCDAVVSEADCSLCANQTDNASKPSFGRPLSAEKRLIGQLLDNYGAAKTGRPVYDFNQVVVVSFNLALIQLDLDEKNRILTLSMWTRYMWKDEYLVWNPEEFGNVTSIRLSQNLIWKPDIMLYNTAEVDKSFRDTLAVISYDGSIAWYPHTIYRSSCSIDVTNFPFDSQQCHMWFGSWTHPASEIDLEMVDPRGIDLSTFQSDYKDSCGWNVLNVTAERTIMPNETDSTNFVILKFDINLKRKILFNTCLLTMPCVFLACLTLVVFWIPPERPDRTGLAMSIFASFMFLLLILIEAAPPSASSIPTLGLYYCFNMILIVLAIILSALVINVSRGCDRPVPKCLSCIVYSSFARFFCLRYQSKSVTTIVRSGVQNLLSPANRQLIDLDPSPEFINGGHKDASALDGTFQHTNNFVDLDTPESVRVRMKDPASDSPSAANLTQHMNNLKAGLLRIEMKLDEMSGSVVSTTDPPNYSKDWIFFAMFLDRFFFTLYILIIIASLLLFFPRPE